jgi:transcriptional regulator with XRE-family HTH domain
VRKLAELLELRRSVGSQKQVGQLLGLSARQVQRYEKGERPVPKWYLLALERLRDYGALEFSKVPK